MARETTAGIRAVLVEHVVDLSDGRLRPGEIDPSAPIWEHGYVDSLSAVTLLEFLRERYGVELSEEDLARGLATLDAVAEHVRREREAA